MPEIQSPGLIMRALSCLKHQGCPLLRALPANSPDLHCPGMLKSSLRDCCAISCNTEAGITPDNALSVIADAIGAVRPNTIQSINHRIEYPDLDSILLILLSASIFS